MEMSTHFETVTSDRAGVVVFWLRDLVEAVTEWQASFPPSGASATPATTHPWRVWSASTKTEGIRTAICHDGLYRTSVDVEYATAGYLSRKRTPPSRHPRGDPARRVRAAHNTALSRATEIRDASHPEIGVSAAPCRCRDPGMSGVPSHGAHEPRPDPTCSRVCRRSRRLFVMHWVQPAM